MKVKNILIVVLLISCIYISCDNKNNSDSLNIDNEGLKTEFLNTGKSDCILIMMDDKNILIDTADADDYENIDKELVNNGVKSIDYLILTHYDKDHIGSASKIISNYKIRTVIRPDYEETSDLYDKMISTLNRLTDTSDITLKEEYIINTKNGKIVINPPKDSEYKDDNNYSLITSLQYGDRRILFTGDALKKRMEEYLSNDISHYDLIKMPHHGEWYKALDELVNMSAPDYEVLTVDNKDRVQQDLIDKAEGSGIEVYYTCNGIITVTSNGTDLNISQ